MVTIYLLPDSEDQGFNTRVSLVSLLVLAGLTHLLCIYLALSSCRVELAGIIGIAHETHLQIYRQEPYLSNPLHPLPLPSIYL